VSNPVPQEIKIKVLSQWLQGISRDKIASFNGVGNGTVSEIIQCIKNSDFDIDLMRQTALTLKKESLSTFDLASSIRLNKILKQYSTTEEDVEEILKDIDIHCFKKNKDKKEFVNEIQNISYLAANFKVPLDELPLHFELLRKKLKSMEAEVIAKAQQVNQTLKEYNITLKDLDEFRSKRHLFNRLTYLEKALEQKNREFDLAMKDIDELVEENEELTLKLKLLSNKGEIKQ
jgi:phenylalanyl-tRNA synthetase alpha subunit